MNSNAPLRRRRFSRQPHPLGPGMVRALKVCSTSGCHELVPSGRCEACDRRADRARGTATERGYGASWARRSRSFVGRHPLCSWRLPGCTLLAVLADHWPLSRRELVRLGVADPDADHRLRPSCDRCHRVRTAHDQPGGWHRG